MHKARCYSYAKINQKRILDCWLANDVDHERLPDYLLILCLYDDDVMKNTNFP